MDTQLLYIILEVLGVLIFASEGLFVKDIELHPYINVMLAYAVYAIISFIVLSVQGKMDLPFFKKLFEEKFLITNFANILKTSGLFMGFKLIPVSFAIVIKMMGPAFIMAGNSILNNEPMNHLQILGVLSSVILIGLIYKKPILDAFKKINMKFFLGVLGVILYNIMNAYNVIRLPQYITDKDPNEEVFLSTGVAFATLVAGFFGLKSFNKNIFGSLNHYNMLKMIGVFVVTCYIGMSLTYAADNHLDPTLFSALQYSQLFLAFAIGYFFEGEKFPISRILLVVLFLASVVFTMKVSKKPEAKDKRKITTNATLFHSPDIKTTTSKA